MVCAAPLRSTEALSVTYPSLVREDRSAAKIDVRTVNGVTIGCHRSSTGGDEVTDVSGDQRSGPRPPRVLLLYYTYTGQSLKVLEAAGEVFRKQGCEVYKAEVEFTDRRFAERFSRFPMRHVWPDMLSVLPAQTRRASGEIRTPDEVRNGDYDLICIGSPTWWRATSMPIRSFLKSDEARKLLCGKPFAVFVVCRRYWRENLKTVRQLGEKQDGQYVGEVHFEYPGGQIRSLLSLTSYLGSGEYRDRYMGVRIPTTNVQPEQLEQTRSFAVALADRLFGKGSATHGEETVRPQ
jgi:menaquinone-dependent protoporphyrinogen IX oxidase